MANPVELRATMDDIEADPESWGQAWVVHYQRRGITTYCFGGRTLIRHGYAPISRDEFYFMSPSGERVHSMSTASRILELNEDEHEVLLYNGIASVTEMRALVEAIIAGDSEIIERYLE